MMIISGGGYVLYEIKTSKKCADRICTSWNNRDIEVTK